MKQKTLICLFIFLCIFHIIDIRTHMKWVTYKEGENKTMENNTKQNTITNELGYNPCPKCGAHAYAVSTEDGMHRVGCLRCGMLEENGIDPKGRGQVRVDGGNRARRQGVFTSCRHGRIALERGNGVGVCLQNRVYACLRT